jgi:outer membrane receptor for ferrienterochelin and colicin
MDRQELQAQSHFQSGRIQQMTIHSLSQAVKACAASARVRAAWSSLVALLLLVPSSQALAQTNQAQLHVTVVDQTGAGIPAATVRVTPAEGASTEFSTDEHGQLTVPDISPQSVNVHAEFPGFEPFDGSFTLRRGTNNQVVTLAIAGVQEDVVVAESGTDDTQGNAMTTVLEEDDIAQLSDDPDELQAQLEAMTGGAGAVFSVDGFRGGRLPSRDEIRQIRFRNNSFSADNHDAGRMQVEIITKPGMAAWAGNANFGLRSDALDARNAFALAETPELFRRFNTGVRGPLVKGKTSLRFNVDGNRSFDSGTIVALTPDGRVADQVKRPFDQTNVTVGLEHGISKNQTLRLEYRNTQDERRNLGVGDFSLMDRAYTRSNDEHQLRASLQTVLGKASLNQLRLQLNQQSTASASASSAPAIVVIDAFTTGGAGVANQGTTRSLMVSDDLDFTLGKHAMRAGLLLNGDHFNNTDNRNAAGTFTFGSLAAYLAGTPDTFTQRLGQVGTHFAQYELGLYWQDEVRLNRSLSVSYGVREEVQSHVDDAFNLMPRFGFTLNPNRSKTTTIRGGYGMFTDWYDASLYDQTLRVNGVAQRDLLVLNPGFPDPTGGITATVLPGGRIQADPDLKLPYIHQMSIGLERKLSPNLNAQVSFTRLDGRNQLRSVNLNAPDEFGIRPEPTVGTITQIESTGRSLINRLNINATYRVPAKRTFINVGYTLANAKNMGDNPLSLPANSFDPDAEWGPSSQDIRHRLNAMVNFSLPSDFRVGIGANAQSGSPYTITTGRDTNGDGVVNDRPDGVGRNSARGDARWDMSARITKSITFGGVRGGTPQRGRAGDQVGPAGPRPGGGPGGGRGVGDALGNAANQRFTMEFYAQAFNLLNHTNFVNYSGSLLSPFFGLPTSAAQARRLEVGLQFRF